MVQQDSVSRILKSAALRPERAADLEKFRRNITVMFTDIKGSTAYFERFGDTAGLLMVDRCNRQLGKIAESHGGRVIKTIGDSIMAAFEDTGEAVVAAVEMQKAITQENAQKSEEERVFIRIGLNYGPGIVKSNDVFGDVANTASRVESAAAPGQVVVSDTLYKTLADSRNVTFRHLGRFALKGKAETRDLFEVVWNDEASLQPTAPHSLITAGSGLIDPAGYKLVQIRRDGSKGAEHAFTRDQLLIGRSEGDLTFPHDAKMQPRHARLWLDSGQLFVESISDSTVFFSLVGPYRLQDGDIVRMGQQLFQFCANMTELERAAASGTKIRELASLLDRPPAEFVSLRAQKGHYPIAEEQVTWGRTNGAYVFPDDVMMSRSHAKVYHRGEDFFLEDAGSRNGTFLRVREKTPVPAGATLSMGGQLLRVARASES